MKVKKCPACSKYTMKNTCEICKKETKEAGYKFRERFVKNSK